MRIISGRARGRRLAVPRGDAVRPTADRVREALFSALGERPRGARVADLFAGSGALGLEALSRGAERAVFVERSRRVIATLKRNIDACAFARQARVLCRDALAAIDDLARRGERFDLIFADPPYRTGDAARTVARVARRELLASGGGLVVEHRRGALEDETFDLPVSWSKSYGDTSLTLFAGPSDEVGLEARGKDEL